VEEDLRNEFKAHRQLSDADMSDKATIMSRKWSAAGGNKDDDSRVRKLPIRRKSLSPYICGMLNTGKGGRMYLGVTDEGKVAGLMMSAFQRDHFRLALADLMRRYTPSVPDHLVRAAFVPVKDKADDVIGKETLGFRTDSTRPHAVRNSKYCWCDFYSLGAMERGLLQPFYVVELIVSPWQIPGNNQSFVDCSAGQINPIFSNEEGKAYMRGFGSTKQLTPADVVDIYRMRREIKAAATKSGFEPTLLNGHRDMKKDEKVAAAPGFEPRLLNGHRDMRREEKAAAAPGFEPRVLNGHHRDNIESVTAAVDEEEVFFSLSDSSDSD